MTGLSRRLEALALPMLLLVAWQVLASLDRLPSFLTSPGAIVSQFVALTLTGEMLQHALISLARSALGLGLAAVFGFSLGLLAGVSRKVQGFFDPLISLTYPVPKIAILPILIVWFGISDTSKIILIMISCFYPCFISAYYGVRSVEATWVWAARNMGAQPTQVFFKVILPAALPQIFTGLRVALALSFILMFASESIGSSNRLGLGFLIISAESGGSFAVMFASIVAIALLGFASDRLLLWARRRAIRGIPSEGSV